MLVGLFTFERFHRKKIDSIGGSRIRMNTLKRYWNEAELWKYGRKYSAIIYQKVYWTEHAKSFDGIKILDLCDPDYFHWGHKVIEMAGYCDAVTCSTEPLAMDLAKFVDKPVWVIPDRLDLNAYPYKKEHTGIAKKFGWFGYSQNFRVINDSGIVKALADMSVKDPDIEFIVISDNLYTPPAYLQGKIKVVNYKWTPPTADQDIQKCDIIINPQLKGGVWGYKSNNKTITAWALGGPVANDFKDLQKFLDPEARKQEIAERQKELVAKYDIRESVKEYKMLIEEIIKNRNVSAKA